jgi:hypothetical protein
MMLFTACEENLSPEAFVRNRTGQAIDVYHVVDGEEQLVVSLDESLSASFDQGMFTTSQFSSGCTTGDLVARATDGSEVARLTQQLCINQGWEIEADGNSRILP